MAKRTYVPTLAGVARKLCLYITLGTPVILRIYPEATNLHTALQAANTACAALHEELEKVREYGD